MTITLQLYAARGGELLASMPVQAALVNRERRLIGGLAVPFNVIGTPSIGRATFRAGSVTVPADPTWVKLLIEHDPLHSVGYLHEYRELAGGLLTAFKVADGPSGDAAIAAAEDKTRDGLSVRVEVDQWQLLPGEVVEVQSSQLREVSLVAVPAYASARVNLAASLPEQEGAALMAELTRMLDLRASAPTPEPAPVPAASPASAVTPEPAPAPSSSPAPGTTSLPVQASTGPLPGGVDVTALAAALAPLLAGPEPQAGPPVTGGGSRGPLTIRAAAEVVAQWQQRDGSNVVALMAALSDVLPADDAGKNFIGRESWLGQLWTAAVTGRPFVEALGTPKPLTGIKAKGWRWVTKPKVGEYAGNKTEIPSNAVKTEPVEMTAHRVAGGWDVDRVYVDLGDADMVAALFEAATEDYRAKSNVYVAGQLKSAATGALVGAAPTDVVDLLVALGAGAAKIGARVSFLAVAADLFGAFAGLTRDQVPWWFGTASASLDPASQSASVPGFRFWSDPFLADGQYLAGDSRAATFYEVGAPAGTPIKVQALNIPQGGVDLGVFGYNAVIVNDARALWAGDLTP